MGVKLNPWTGRFQWYGGKELEGRIIFNSNDGIDRLSQGSRPYELFDVAVVL